MTILIPGEPFSQPRARSVIRRRRGGQIITDARGNPVIGHYDDPKAKSWKGAAAWHMQRAMKEAKLQPLAGPVKLRVVAVFTCPPSQHRKQPRPRRFHTKKPDGDNVIKAVKDAAKGVLWGDDAQVCDARIRKFIGAQGEAPFVRIEVQQLDEGSLQSTEGG